MQDLSLYDYELPEDRIAQTPLEPRDAAKLLWLSRKTGEIRHKRFSDLPDLLEEGDLLVLNDTRVTALRLKGRRETGGGVELLLLRPLEGAKYVALCKPAKRLRAGTEIELSETLTATVLDDGGQGLKTLQLRCSNNLEEELSRVGRVPLPPYIHSSLPDAERYQTVFARSPGSSAAPTAALHFTSQLLDRLRCKGVHTAFVSLDIGLDTFRPIQSEQVEDHLMHGELCRLPEETAFVEMVADAVGDAELDRLGAPCVQRAGGGGGGIVRLKNRRSPAKGKLYRTSQASSSAKEPAIAEVRNSARGHWLQPGS